MMVRRVRDEATSELQLFFYLKFEITGTESASPGRGRGLGST